MSNDQQFDLTRAVEQAREVVAAKAEIDRLEAESAECYSLSKDTQVAHLWCEIGKHSPDLARAVLMLWELLQTHAPIEARRLWDEGGEGKKGEDNEQTSD